MKNRHLYPPNWKTISRRCRELAGNRCEHCSVSHGAERLSKRGNIYRVALAACHADHKQRLDPDARLLCLCEICHWWHDFEMDQLEQWRRLERLKHLTLITVERIRRARLRALEVASIA